MLKSSVYVVLILCFFVTLSGCGPRKTVDLGGGEGAKHEMTYDEVVSTWMWMSLEELAAIDTQQAIVLVQRMAEEGPEGLDPVLEILGSPDASPSSKVLAVICLSPLIPTDAGEGLFAPLMAMTEPEHEVSTRACATHLVGLFGPDKVLDRIRELLNDPERRVSTAALLIAFPKGMPEAAARVRPFWEDETTTMHEREQLILAFPEQHMATHLDLFISALMDHQLGAQARIRAIGVLGEATGDKIVETLAAVTNEEDVDAQVKVSAAGALAAVQARMERGETGAVAYMDAPPVAQTSVEPVTAE